MKIAIDASRYGHSEATGVENYSRQIIDGILKIGKKHKITLYDRKNVKWKRFWTLIGLSLKMLTDKPDVLFVPSHVLPLIGGKKNVITIHDTAFRHLKNSYSFFQYHYLNWSTKFAVKHADAIIVPSLATKRDLIHFYKCKAGKIKVVPHGFAAHKKTFNPKNLKIIKYLNISPQSDYFLFIGRLESKKNLVRLIKAFAEFLKKHKNYKLILAGKRGVGFAKTLKVANDLLMAKKVLMPGYVNEDEKNFLLKNCRAFCFPSLYEGFGFPILEAFYFGKPVICGNVSSMPEVGGKAAIYVNPLDEKEICRALLKLAERKQSNKVLEQSRIKQAKKFSWTGAAKSTLAVLESVWGV